MSDPDPKVGRFEFCDLGIDNCQYFQGFGRAFTDWKEAQSGQGGNPAEAVDDLLESISQYGWDVEGLEARLLKSVNRKKWPKRPAANGEDVYYYVGLRWDEATPRRYVTKSRVRVRNTHPSEDDR